MLLGDSCPGRKADWPTSKILSQSKLLLFNKYLFQVLILQSSQKPELGGGVTAPSLQMRKLKFRKYMPPAPGHTASEQRNKDLKSCDCF